MTDVLIQNTENGGDIELIDGNPTLTGGLKSAFYLALFGGNKEDNGSENTNLQWWGNLNETDPTTHYRSRTQNLLQSLVPSSGNLRVLESTIERDLNFFIEIGAVTELTISASLVDVKKVQIDISVFADGEKIDIRYLENWKAMEAELT